jgi:MFS family permease
LSLFADFRSLDRRVFILAAARLVVTLGFSAVLPYLAVTLHRERGVSSVIIGAIWTIGGLSGAAMQWVAGEVTDRVGRRPILLGAMALRTVNLVALGYEILHRGPVPIIAILFVLNGILRAFFDPVASAMVADLATGEHRIAAFSLQRFGLNIGWVLGSASVGITNALHLAYGQIFYISAGITLAATVAASFIVETRVISADPARPRTPFRFSDLGLYWQDQRFVRFLFATFFFFLLQAQLYAPLSIYAADHLHMSLAAVSHLYTVNGFIVVLLQLPAFYLIRRIGTHKVLVVGALAYAIAYALCGLALREWHLLVFVGLITLAEIISSPAQQTAATGMAPPERIGAYAGLYGLTQAAGQSFGPLVGTSLLDAFPDRLTWPLLALFGIAAMLLYRKLNRTPATAHETRTAAAVGP